MRLKSPPITRRATGVFNGVISGVDVVGLCPLGGAGIVVFNAANTFNDSAVQAGGNGPAGYSLLLSGGNVGLGIDSVSIVSPPAVDSGPVGTGILGLSVGEGGNDSLFASGGTHTVGNAIAYTSTTNSYTLSFNGSNNLTLSGTFALSTGSDSFGTNRVWDVGNTAWTTLSGAITDAGLGSGVTKTGSGVLYLNGVNTYAGSTTVSVGLLAGTGTIAGPVVVQTNGVIGGGSGPAIGTLNLSSNLTLDGNVFIRVNKSLSPAQSNDIVSVTGALSNIGTGTTSRRSRAWAASASPMARRTWWWRFRSGIAISRVNGNTRREGKICPAHSVGTTPRRLAFNSTRNFLTLTRSACALRICTSGSRS